MNEDEAGVTSPSSPRALTHLVVSCGTKARPTAESDPSMHQDYAADMSWTLRDLVQSIPEIRFALVASSDGKALASFGAEDPADIDRFAAVVAGLQALATPMAEQFPTYNGQLRLAMIEVDGGHLFVSRAGLETYLGVLAKEGLDQGLLGHQMRDLSRRMGERLCTSPRIGCTTVSP